MRGVLRAALLSATALLFFAGCAAMRGRNERVSVDALVYGGTEAEADWLRIVGAFEAVHPHVEIESDIHYDLAYHQRVSVRLAAGHIPDIAYMSPDVRWGAPWKAAGQQFDHLPYLDPTYYDLELIPDMGPPGGAKEIYEIPIGTPNITTVLYMNQTLATSLGFGVPESYDDLEAMVPAARKAGVDVITIDGFDRWAWASCLLSTLIARFSGEADWIQGAVAGRHRFTDPAFISALDFLRRMRADGVFAGDVVDVDYGQNLARFNNGQAVFMIQGQWAATVIEPQVADNTLVLALPALPGESPAMAGSVAVAFQTGYGLTNAGGSRPSVRDAAFALFRFFHSHEETPIRLRRGSIVAPILKDFQVPPDLPPILRRKIALAQSAGMTDVVDVYLAGRPNDALNSGLQSIVKGTAKGAGLSSEVEGLMGR